MFEVFGLTSHAPDSGTTPFLEVQDKPADELVDVLAKVMVGNLPIVIRNGMSSLDGLSKNDRRHTIKANKKAHNKRVVAVVTALRQTMPERRWIHELENDSRSFGAHSPEHTDGLKGQYIQVHTTKETNYVRATSHVLLRAYPADIERHLELVRIRQAIMDTGIVPNSDATVSVAPRSDMPERFLMPALDSSFGNPVVYEAYAGAYDTLVFPNGYDAGDKSEPAVLWTHEFESVTQPGCANDWREVAISRIEAV